MENFSRIHGEWYDLTKFNDHPGGLAPLKSAKGRDATVLFESHHPFSSKQLLKQMMQKYKVSVPEGSKTADETTADTLGFQIENEPFDFLNKSEFALELIKNVRQYFVQESRRRGITLFQATKATPTKKLFLSITTTLFVISLRFLTLGNYFALVAAPFFGWLLVSHGFHDFSHFSCFGDSDLDNSLSYLFPYFSSPTTWNLQHIVGHHMYTNIVNRDPDIQHTADIRRDHPGFKWVEAHGNQNKPLALILHWCLAVFAGMNIANEYFMVTGKSYNASVPFLETGKLRILRHLLARAATSVTMLAWPFVVLDYSIPMKILFAIVPPVLLSLQFMANSQVNHLAPDVINPAPTKDWYKHEVETAQNFGNNWLIYFFTSGGLNLQIEHHLFPAVNHCHLMALQPIVQAACEKYGVKYHMASGYKEAIKNYMDHTNTLAEKPKVE